MGVDKPIPIELKALKQVIFLKTSECLIIVEGHQNLIEWHGEGNTLCKDISSIAEEMRKK